ncbi:MAG TPA: sulfite oxidase-like oxidoreductase [Alphaproteobacteria bacterium]
MADDDTPKSGAIKEKLIRSKQAWARDGRLLTGHSAPPAQRLPPGQRKVEDWPVLDLGVTPSVDPKKWKLVCDGLVQNPVAWDWDAFMAQPQVTMTSDIHCVTGWSRFDNAWTGVHALHLLDVVQPAPDARHIVFHSHDGYTTNVRLDYFADGDVLLAHSWQGQPLEIEHGGPVRVVIPKRYFWKSAKWVRRIEFLAEDRPSYWEVNGYHNEADPWTEERYG